MTLTTHRIPRSVLAVTVALGLSVTPAGACSRAGSPLIDLPASNAVFLLGTARADSLRTGAGSVVLEGEAPSADLPAQRQRVHGQWLDVERVAGPSRALLPTGARRVVLVAWGYSADCKPVLNKGSAIWVLPGTRGVYSAVVRPREQWIGGVPVLDVFATAMKQPYVQGVQPYMTSRRLDAEKMMTADDVLSLLDLLPTREVLLRDPTSATGSLLSWARATPGQARLYPAVELLSIARSLEQRAQLQAVRHPATGTYRLALRVDGGPPYELFARTATSPSSGGWMDHWQPSGDPLAREPYELYELQTFLAPTLSELPEDCGGQYTGRFAYLSLQAALSPDSTGTPVAAAQIELKAFERTFLRDTLLQRLSRASFSASSQRFNRNDLRPIGLVRIDAAGAARLAQHEQFADGTRATVTGERLSPVTITCQPNF